MQAQPVPQSHTCSMPEEATLLQLCAIAKTGIFQIEKNGQYMAIAYLNIDGQGYLYHDGDSVDTAHLFFLLTYLPYKIRRKDVLEEVNNIYGVEFIASNQN